MSPEELPDRIGSADGGNEGANDLDPSQDPVEIERGWLGALYSTPPDLVLNERTGFPASIRPDKARSNKPMQSQRRDGDDWKDAFRVWFKDLYGRKGLGSD